MECCSWSFRHFKFKEPEEGEYTAPSIWHVEVTAEMEAEPICAAFSPLMYQEAQMRIIFNFKYGEEIFSGITFIMKETDSSTSHAFLRMFENAFTMKGYIAIEQIGRFQTNRRMPKDMPSMWNCPLILNITHLPEVAQRFIKQLVTNQMHVLQIEK